MITEFASRDALMHAAADRIENALRDGLSRRGAAYAALSGGSTPEPAYTLLSERALDWPHVGFLLVDERFVPPTDPGSNEGMLRRALAPALDEKALLLPMYDAAGIDEAVSRSNDAFDPLPIDIAVMGMGADGHTASWFPGARGLEEALDPTSDRTVVAIDAPGAAGSAQRLTLTLVAVLRAECAILLITGEEKRAVLDRALVGNLPVAALLSHPALEVLWAA